MFLYSPHCFSPIKIFYVHFTTIDLLSTKTKLFSLLLTTVFIFKLLKSRCLQNYLYLEDIFNCIFFMSGKTG